MGPAAETRTSPALAPELARVPGHLLWRGAARVTMAIDERMPPDVDVHAHSVLVALAPGGSRSQQRLADAVSISRTTMTRVVADLAGRGLLERVRNPEDRRSYALTRTRSGAAAERRWRQHVEAVEQWVTGGLSPGERDELVELLVRVGRPWLAPDTPPQLRETLCFLLSRTHARTHAQVLAALRHLDVEPRHLGSLLVLGGSGPLSQSELARTLGISGPTVVEIADHLERRGLIERRSLDHDRRAHVLHRLPRAGLVTTRARRLATECTDALLAPLSAADQERLMDLLALLLTADQ